MLLAMRIMSVATQIRVADLERALRFYVESLGFEEEFRFGDFYAGLRAGGNSLHLKQIGTPDPSIAFVREGDHLHLYFSVVDLDAAFSELEGKAELVYPITTKPWGDREFTIRDPDGHTIYLAQARK
jgi:catechol 2,3-dioxygenase-like lactoylglutathione lyase family enzyme